MYIYYLYLLDQKITNILNSKDKLLNAKAKMGSERFMALLNHSHLMKEKIKNHNILWYALKKAHKLNH